MIAAVATICVARVFEAEHKKIELCCVIVCHSVLMSNQTKVWKTKKGSLQGDKAWSRDPKSALFEILRNKEHFY